MSVTLKELNNVKVFNLSAGKSLNQFMQDSEKTKKSLRYDQEFKNRVELIQDLEFPTASGRVRVSKDGQYIAASGVYPPQLRIYDTSELSLKCQRNLEAEIVQFQFLSEDYKKVAMLCDNRSIELHAQYGRHYSTRIPRFGRDLTFNPYNCELYVVGATYETYRLNLEQGRFMSPLESNLCEEMNVVELCENLKWILGCGGDEGILECWDLRTRSRAAVIETNSSINALKFDNTDNLVAVGGDEGLTQVYDLRYPKPVYSVKHYNQLPIKGLSFHEGGKYLLSADSKAVKVVDKTNGSLLTTIESPEDIHDLELCGKSGLFFTANEGQRVGTFFVPSLGPAPSWCGFVESLTEELEEQKPSSLQENKQFVTYEELEEINGSELIGSDSVQAYMHGYLIDSKLYYKLKALSQPFDFEEYRKERIRKKIEEKTAERIVVRKKAPKVNKQLAEEILVETETKKKKGPSLMEDQRFSALFNDEKFQINEESQEFKRLNPGGKKRKPMPAVTYESSEEETINPKPQKKPKKDNLEVVEDNQTQEASVPLKDLVDSSHSKPKKQFQRVRRPKHLKHKPNTEGRRTMIPMHKLLHKK